MNITYQKLKETHPKNADEIWNKICDLGGFGQIDRQHSGGLDLSGLDAKQKKEIETLLAAKQEK